MPSWSTLLRIVLSLLLVLNGTGAAMASARMQVLHSSDTIASPAALHEAMAACQHHGSSGEGHQQVHPGSHPAGVLAEDPAGSDAPDCCQSDACRCACVHQIQLLTGLAWLRAPLLVNPASLTVMPSVHPSPPLPHLIRPPIG